MADFFQNGIITTFQELGPRDDARMEAELAAYAAQRPLALVLPCLYTELQGPALGRILDELARVSYVREVVVSLGGADPAQFRHAVEFFSRLPQKVQILWNDGPRIEGLKAEMREHNLHLGEPGKGLAAWMAYGYVLGDPEVRVLALHDCDILTYDRILLDRLVYPILSPLLDYEFCKGYYARVSGRLYGRATRIFVTPFVRALQKLLGRTTFLAYLDSFRYPLSGEFAMNVDVARINRIPSDWGLEMGTLAEVFRNYSTRRVCQVDLGIDYEHKHQETGTGDPGKGLMRMAKDIALAGFHALASEGAQLSASFFRSLRAAYLRCAQDAIRQYADLSAINGLAYDRHEEDVLAESFVQVLEIAGVEFRKNPFGSPQIPNWNRVSAAIPDIFDRLRSEVDADHGN
ncbi:MAG: glycosyl transferase [Deltaproteobacteria bacterium]|nr:glycosyl transferase [Deltaproteobacteria bacterium]